MPPGTFVEAKRRTLSAVGSRDRGYGLVPGADLWRIYSVAGPTVTPGSEPARHSTFSPTGWSEELVVCLLHGGARYLWSRDGGWTE